MVSTDAAIAGSQVSHTEMIIFITVVVPCTRSREMSDSVFSLGTLQTQKKHPARLTLVTTIMFSVMQ